MAVFSNFKIPIYSAPPLASIAFALRGGANIYEKNRSNH